MNKYIDLADYIIALSTNTVNDKIRKEYKLSINDYDSSLESFEVIVKHIFDFAKKEKSSAEHILNLIKVEYESLGLSEFLGDYNNYKEFLELLLNSSNHTADTTTLDELKGYITIADKLNNSISKTLYYAVLVSLTLRNMLMEDLEFSRMVMEYVKNSEFPNEGKIFHELIFDAINHN